MENAKLYENLNLNKEDYSQLRVSTNLYDSVWVLCAEFDNFIIDIMTTDLEENCDVTNPEDVKITLNDLSVKIDKFISKNRGDIKAIINGTDLGDDVPAGKKSLCKLLPVKTEYLIKSARIDIEIILEDLDTSPMPEMEEYWDEIKPAFMDFIEKCSARLDDAEEIINKMKELTKNL